MSFDMNPADEDPHGECRQEIASLRGEVDRLRQFSRRQAEEIENLNGMADAVEVLRDIGKVVGCGHVDGPDERRQLVNCIEQEFDRLREDNRELQFYRETASEPVTAWEKLRGHELRVMGLEKELASLRRQLSEPDKGPTNVELSA